MIHAACDHITIHSEGGLTETGAEVHLTSTPNGFHVELSAPALPITQVVLRWKQPLPEGIRILGDHWERGYGDLEWRGVAPERVMPWYALLFDPKHETTRGLGVATGAASLASWRIDQHGVSLVLDVRNGNRGVRLGQRTLRAATVLTLESKPPESPFAFAHRFCRLLCPTPRLPAKPVYGGNDWYYAYGRNTDAGIRRDAALIRELSPGHGQPPYMVMDDGWFPDLDPDGPYQRGNDRFPDMPGLADALKAMEVEPGIWVRPLLVARAPNSCCLPARHPVWKRLADKVVLDPSVPEVLQRVRDDIARMRAWGYTLIKHDFTTFDLTGRWGFEMTDGLLSSGEWHFADTSRTTAEIIRGLYQAIREAAGDITLIGCNTIGHLGAGLFELQRTGDDTSGQEWERTRKMGVNTLAFRMAQHNAFFAVDADCVGLTRQVPWPLNRQWLELLAGSGTPLFVSAEPAAVGPEQRAALSTAFALAASSRPSAEPLDWMDTTCPCRWQFGKDQRTFNWFNPAL
jgi:alpha-galactosidase